jgi:PAS domain-containing protein
MTMTEISRIVDRPASSSPGSSAAVAHPGHGHVGGAFTSCIRSSRRVRLYIVIDLVNRWGWRRGPVLQVTAVLGRAGHPKLLAAASRDVTERRMAHEALRDSHARLRAATGICHTDAPPAGLSPPPDAQTEAS